MATEPTYEEQPAKEGIVKGTLKRKTLSEIFEPEGEELQEHGDDENAE